jgi:hypothetical protein
METFCVSNYVSYVRPTYTVKQNLEKWNKFPTRVSMQILMQYLSQVSTPKLDTSGLKYSKICKSIFIMSLDYSATIFTQIWPLAKGIENWSFCDFDLLHPRS